jgi:hypothetical protein
VTDYALWSGPVSGIPDAPTTSSGFGAPTSLATFFTLGAPRLYLKGYRYLITDQAQISGGPGTNRYALWAVTGKGAGSVEGETTVTSRTLAPGDAGTLLDTLVGTPVPLAQGVTFAAAVGDAQQGPFTEFYWTGTEPGHAGITAGPLTGFSDLVSFGGSNPDPDGNNQGSFQQASNDPTAAFPTVQFDSSNFWISPIITDVPGFTATRQSTDGNGVETWSVASSLNGPNPTTLRILRPTAPAAGYPHAFIYALPVVAGLDDSFGDGMTTLQQLGANNQYNVTVIAPSFPIQPWYADNPLNLWQQEESFMLGLASWAARTWPRPGSRRTTSSGSRSPGSAGRASSSSTPACSRRARRGMRRSR